MKIEASHARKVSEISRKLSLDSYLFDHFFLALTSRDREPYINLKTLFCKVHSLVLAVFPTCFRRLSLICTAVYFFL